MQTTPYQLRARAESRPDDVAVELLGDGQLTYSAWDRRSNAVARGMVERGVNKGDRVLLPCDTADWLDYAIGYVATHKAGGVAIPVATRLGRGHTDWAFAKAGAVGILAPTPTEFTVHPTWCATVKQLESGRSAEPLESVVEPQDVAEILYTSGTTGVAKGVVASHASVLYTHSKRMASAQPGRVVLHCLPPATTVGQGLLLQPLNPSPHRILTLPRYDDWAFLSAVHDHRPTDIVLVPALALSLIRAESARQFDLTSVLVVRTTSAPIAFAALAKLDAMFPHATTINMYASTETWPARTRIRFDPTRPGSIGRPAGGSALRIADSKGNTLDPGEVGEVHLRLEGAPRRWYDGDTLATAEVFLPDGWVRTGDVGYVDEDSYLYLVDRNADLINTGGLNVSTLEVEAVLHEHPAVIEAAAFGAPHSVLGEYVAAAVRLADPEVVADLHSFAEARLGPQRTPIRIFVVDQFPRNAAGKILKRSLREQVTEELPKDSSGARLNTPTERLVASLWEQSLDIEGVRADDDFLALGGTSLTAAEVTARLRQRLSREVSLREIFDAPTLADFARRVDAAAFARPDPGPTLERVQRTAHGPG